MKKFPPSWEWYHAKETIVTYQGTRMYVKFMNWQDLDLIKLQFHGLLGVVVERKELVAYLTAYVSGLPLPSKDILIHYYPTTTAKDISPYEAACRMVLKGWGGLPNKIAFVIDNQSWPDEMSIPLTMVEPILEVLV